MKRKEITMISLMDFLDKWPTAKDGKKRKVVKRRFSQGVIDYIMAHPYTMDYIPDQQLAKQTKFFRESYAQRKETAKEIMAYQRSLIVQYKAKGYAEEHTEVTDDEEETVDN